MGFKNITITGFGHAAHAFTVLLKDVTVYSTTHQEGKVKVKSDIGEGEAIVSSNPEFCFSDTDLVLVTNPGNFYEEIYDEIRQVNETCKIVFTPGQNGVSEFCEEDKHVYSLSPMPFNCRIDEKGKHVSIKAVKENYFLFGEEDNEFSSILKETLNWSKKIEHKGSIYYADFVPLNSIIHSARMCNLFEDSDFLHKNEIFYADMKQVDTTLMEQLSKEYISHIEEKDEFFISNFLPKFVYEWDDCSLLEFFTGNGGYSSKLPVKEIDDKFYPDKNSRYLFEDIHNLKAVHKKLTELDVKHPITEKCLKIMEEINDKSR